MVRQAIYSFHIGDGLKETFDEDTAIKEMVAADKIEIIFDEKWHVGVNASDMFYFATDDHVEIESHEALEGAVPELCCRPQERPCRLGIEGSQHAALSSVLYRSNEGGWDMDRGA